MASHYSKLIPGQFAHICNRAVGTDKMFLTEENYLRFLQMLQDALAGIAEINAYCLLSNHYHLLVRLHETSNHDLLKNALNKVQSKYAKAFNRENGRKGGLFMRPFKRKAIQNDAHLAYITWYIHRNPLHHRYTKNWRTWPYSSYDVYDQGRSSFIKTGDLICFFGGIDRFKHYHELNSDAYLNGDAELHLE